MTKSSSSIHLSLYISYKFCCQHINFNVHMLLRFMQSNTKDTNIELFESFMMKVHKICFKGASCVERATLNIIVSYLLCNKICCFFFRKSKSFYIPKYNPLMRLDVSPAFVLHLPHVVFLSFIQEQ